MSILETLAKNLGLTANSQTKKKYATVGDKQLKKEKEQNIK